MWVLLYVLSGEGQIELKTDKINEPSCVVKHVSAISAPGEPFNQTILNPSVMSRCGESPQFHREDLFWLSKKHTYDLRHAAYCM